MGEGASDIGEGELGDLKGKREGVRMMAEGRGCGSGSGSKFGRRRRGESENG